MDTQLPGGLAAAIKGVLRRFRSQRPLRGGSLLITIFGDAIAPRGGVITLGSLIRLAQPFGLTERLVRTSVARLAAEGWLVARREGRQSEYRLTATGEQRFAEATRRIYGEGPRSWEGRWTLLFLPARRQRRDLREELRWLGFGQLGPGLFAHPGCTLAQARGWIQELQEAADALLLQSSGESVAADKEIVALGWNLGELSRRYRRFVETFAPVERALGASAAVDVVGTRAAAVGAVASGAVPDESAFVVRTLLIHEYRKIHLRDPLLPPALLPGDWIGAAAYELCRRLYPAVFERSESYLTRNASSLQQPLPAPEPSVYERFGGMTRN